MYTLTIIGAGITGLCLLLLLEENQLPLESVVIVDPSFIGGDLISQWGPVQSNTPWQKTLDALRQTCPTLSLSRLEQRIGDLSKSCPLTALGFAIKELAWPALKKVAQVQNLATRVDYSSSEQSWTVVAGNTYIKSRAVVFAQGAIPKVMDVGIPSIPLSIALDSKRLRDLICLSVEATPRVLVFGTMHSGALVIRNLIEDCSANVMALYNTETPFTWDRDGAYDGIKREAADIADRIVRGDWKDRLTLAKPEQTSELLRFAKQADWVVYAMGFKPRLDIQVEIDGSSKSLAPYNGKTGALIEAPAAWGFGVAYPNQAPDGVHWDVSIAAFLLHMKAQIPSIALEFKKPL